MHSTVHYEKISKFKRTFELGQEKISKFQSQVSGINHIQVQVQSKFKCDDLVNQMSIWQ